MSAWTLYEVYVWWCEAQGVEPYEPGSKYLHADRDGKYGDAETIWQKFCSTD